MFKDTDVFYVNNRDYLSFFDFVEDVVKTDSLDKSEVWICGPVSFDRERAKENILAQLDESLEFENDSDLPSHKITTDEIKLLDDFLKIYESKLQGMLESLRVITAEEKEWLKEQPHD